MVRAGAVVFLLLAAAGAHETKTPKRDRLELSPARARLVIEYVISAADAQQLREIFRGRELTGYLVQQATHFVALTLDGKKLVLHQDQVTPFELGVRVELSAPIEKPRHVTLEDRHKDRRISVPVEVVLDGLTLQTPLPPRPFVFADHPLELDLK